MIEEIIGLKPAEAGWASVSFQPRIPQAMQDFRLEFHTVRGKVTGNLPEGL